MLTRQYFEYRRQGETKSRKFLLLSDEAKQLVDSVTSGFATVKLQFERFSGYTDIADVRLIIEYLDQPGD